MPKQSLIVLSLLVLIFHNTSLYAEEVDPAMERTTSETAQPPTTRPTTQGGIIVTDGGLEAGSPNPFWEESSQLFGSPICSNTCGMPASSGNYYAWFGGSSSSLEVASLAQTITIPSNSATLTFQLMMGVNGGQGELDVQIDGHSVATFTHEDVSQFAAYQVVTINLDSYADNRSHELRFEAITYPTGVTNFFVDEITVVGEPTAVSLATATVHHSSTATITMLFALMVTVTVRTLRRGQTQWKA